MNIKKAKDLCLEHDRLQEIARAIEKIIRLKPLGEN